MIPLVIDKKECGCSSADASGEASSADCQSMISCRSSATCQTMKSVSRRVPTVV